MIPSGQPHMPVALRERASVLLAVRTVTGGRVILVGGLTLSASRWAHIVWRRGRNSAQMRARREVELTDGTHATSDSKQNEARGGSGTEG